MWIRGLVLVGFGLGPLLLSACIGAGDPSGDPSDVESIEAPFTTGARCSSRRDCPSVGHSTVSCRNQRCNYACNTGFKACGTACIPSTSPSCCTSADCAGAVTACGGVCGTNHLCSYPTGTTCGSATCAGSARIGPGTCANGVCQFPAPTACPGNALCSGAGICSCAIGSKLCGTTCIPNPNCCTNADCPGGVCSAGMCS